MVRYLCERGADVNASDTTGNPAAHAAAFHGDVAVLRYLRSRGAVMKASTSRLGDTRLVHFAALSSLMLCGSSQRSAALTLTEFPTSIACALPQSVGTTLLQRIA